MLQVLLLLDVWMCVLTSTATILPQDLAECSVPKDRVAGLSCHLARLGWTPSYTRDFGDGPRYLNHGQMTWMTTGLAPSSPNYYTIPTGERFSFRQIQRASLPYTAGL
ncbi:hypothetical protein TNCV_2541881 [Trichonephila clavipes]|nr:hypothetical protein TNCV_2541881 [Trichonephila clavipes]